MAENEIHLGDIGTIFEITLKDDAGPVDLNGATTTDFKFKKPDVDGVEGELITKAAVVDGDPTTGILRYTTIADDLDVLGNWQIQVFLVLAGGSWNSDIGTFKVWENLT